MGLKDVTAAQWAQLLTVDESLPYLADSTGMTPEYLGHMRRIVSAFVESVDRNVPKDDPQFSLRSEAQSPRRPAYVLPVPPLPEPLTLTADTAIVTSDLHLPFLNYPLFLAACYIAKRHGVRHWIDAGDLFDNDHAGIKPFKTVLQRAMPTFTQVTAQAWAVYARVLEAVEVIYRIDGNHDAWFAQALGGQMTIADLMADNRIISSPIRYMTLHTTQGDYRISHPKNASRQVLSVPTKLQHKYPLTHYVMGHNHRTGISKATDGQAWVIELGGLFDVGFMEYVQLVDNTAPAMTGGFLLIEDGYPKLYFADMNWQAELGDDYAAWRAEVQAVEDYLAEAWAFWQVDV